MTNDVTTVGNVSEENKLAMTSTLGAKFRSRGSVSRNVASLIEHRGRRKEGTNERTNEREGTKGKKKNERENPVKGGRLRRIR